MIVLEGYLSEEQRRVLFHVADAVLANSGVEPFGLVGLETMAVGGVAFVGSTGEDYVTHGHDAISIQTSEAREIVHQAVYLRGLKERDLSLRQAAKLTAVRHTWQSVIRRVLLPFLDQLHASRIPQSLLSSAH
jgi:glycosyltransferase involved in cell wall biosynthesis